MKKLSALALSAILIFSFCEKTTAQQAPPIGTSSDEIRLISYHSFLQRVFITEPKEEKNKILHQLVKFTGFCVGAIPTTALGIGSATFFIEGCLPRRKSIILGLLPDFISQPLRNAFEKLNLPLGNIINPEGLQLNINLNIPAIILCAGALITFGIPFAIKNKIKKAINNHIDYQTVKNFVINWNKRNKACTLPELCPMFDKVSERYNKLALSDTNDAETYVQTVAPEVIEEVQKALKKSFLLNK